MREDLARNWKPGYLPWLLGAIALVDFLYPKAIGFVAGGLLAFYWVDLFASRHPKMAEVVSGFFWWVLIGVMLLYWLSGRSAGGEVPRESRP